MLTVTAAHDRRRPQGPYVVRHADGTATHFIGEVHFVMSGADVVNKPGESVNVNSLPRSNKGNSNV